jgi:predicted amidohydrolase YtcJ
MHNPPAEKDIPLLSVLVLSMVLAATLASCVGNPPADTVLKNGFVYTVDPEGSVAQAVAIRDRKIVFVGSSERAMEFVGDQTEVIDLQDRMLLPGFVDSHFHPASGAGRVFNLQLRGFEPTKENYQAAVRKFADSHPDAAVIWGRGWSQASFAGFGPRKEWLDAVVPDRPVILTSDGGHSTWVNSRALEIAGITRETPDPAGGVIERDSASGEPTGTLREAASGLIDIVDPEDFSVEQYREGFRWLQDHLTGSLGITGLFSAGGSVGSNAYAALEQLSQSGAMTFWLRGAYTARPSFEVDEWLEQAVEARGAHKTRHFQISAIKFFEDGVIESHTAWLIEPYANAQEHGADANFRGLQLWQPRALAAAVAAAHARGFQTHHHAIADASVAEALDAIAHSRRVNGQIFPDSRDGLTHLTLVDPPDFQRFADLGVVAVTQPQWFLKDDYYYNVFAPFLGQERADRSYPMKRFFDAGAIVASSSDWSVTEPPNPLYGIQTAVQRVFPRPPFGGRIPTEVLWPEERITVDQAIRSYTINGAYSNFLEATRGSIEIGKYADLIVLDKNLLRIDPSEISSAIVLLTLFEGKAVFRHPSF